MTFFLLLSTEGKKKSCGNKMCCWTLNRILEGFQHKGYHVKYWVNMMVQKVQDRKESKVNNYGSSHYLLFRKYRNEMKKSNIKCNIKCINTYAEHLLNSQMGQETCNKLFQIQKEAEGASFNTRHLMKTLFFLFFYVNLK